MKRIGIIIPCCNEEDNIELVLRAVDRYMKPLEYQYGFLFVDDGSTDRTYDRIADACASRQDATVIRLSRNFGKEAAIAVGLSHCSADAAIIMDCDLQHPPYLLPAMVSEWECGSLVVDGVKSARQKENFLTRIMSLGFYKIMKTLTGYDFDGASDYKLLDRAAIQILNTISEKNRFFRGLTNWIGLKHSRIEYKVERRLTGRSKWNWFKLTKLSIDAIASFSSKPLQIVSILGGFTFVFSLVLAVQTLYNRFFGSAVSGFTTVILVLLFLSSVIMMSIGILGIYLSKVYDEIKSRPLYVIQAERSRTGEQSTRSGRMVENYGSE